MRSFSEARFAGSGSGPRPGCRASGLVVGSVFVLAALLVQGPAAARSTPSRVQVAVDNRDGLQVMVFSVEEGAITVLLPDDLAAGERFTGSISLASDPVRPRKGEALGKRLRKHSLDAGGIRIEAGRPLFHLRLGCGKAGGGGKAASCEGGGANRAPYLPIRLRNPKGKILAEARLGLLREPPPESAAITYSGIGQAGRAFEIRGPLAQDSQPGGFGVSWVGLGGVEAPLLAASPRRIFVRLPPLVTGPAELALRSQGETRKGRLRAVGVQLDAGKPALFNGERTTLRLQVSGLQGLERALPIELVSDHPQSARLESGIRQLLTVHPSEAQGRGVYQWVGTLVGVGPGPVAISVRFPEAPRMRLEP